MQVSYAYMNHLVMLDQHDHVRQWHTVHDNVMGGVSRGQIHLEEKYVLFSGEVSLENNGGFASAHFKLPELDLREYRKFRLHLCGDGKTYSFRVRWTSFPYASYSCDFDTSGSWQSVDLPFAEFIPRRRGTVLRGLPALQDPVLYQAGFLIADKQSGPFTLKIARIEVV